MTLARRTQTSASAFWQRPRRRSSNWRTCPRWQVGGSPRLADPRVCKLLDSLPADPGRDCHRPRGAGVTRYRGDVWHVGGRSFHSCFHASYEHRGLLKLAETTSFVPVQPALAWEKST